MLTEDTAVPAVKLIHLPLIREPRGSLAFGEYDAHLPFIPLRYFIVFDVPAGQTRGQHAHRRVSQALVCLAGRVAVAVDDGQRRDEIMLDSPARALIVPPRVWAAQTFSAAALLLVLCSETYDADEYIRDYGEFIEIVSAT
ncbi:MAG: UDP-2-acetamido-3-amino-2,3-dideoxy-glucuronate N-acetyltransferase [Blastocatellia bacterium]